MEIDAKRFYIDKVVKKKCPNCKKKVVRDFNDEYLSYPVLNKAMNISFWCSNCDYSWPEKFILKVELEEVKC